MKLLYSILLLFISSPSFAQMQACPANINFSQTNLTHWEAYTGNNQGGNGPSAIKTVYDSLWQAPTGTIGVSVIPEYLLPAVPGIQVITSPSVDLYGGFTTIPTINGYAYNYSILLGSTSTSSRNGGSPSGAGGGYIRGVSYKINVPAGPASRPYTMTYAYAMVLENGSHISNQQPLFSATLMTSDSVITCASPKYFLPTIGNSNGGGNNNQLLDTAVAEANGFTLSPVLSPHPDPASNQSNAPHLQDVWTKGWREVTFDLSAYRGQQVTLNFEADNCVPGGHFAYAYVALRKTCAGLLIHGDSVVCPNSNILYSVPELAGASYQWSAPGGWTINSGTSSNSIQVTAGKDGGFIVVKEQNSCANLSDSLPVNVLSPTLNVPNPSPVCAPATVDLTNIENGSSPNMSFSFWSDSAATNPLPDPSSIGSSGIYFIRELISSGCSAIAPVTVTVNPRPDFMINNPAPICAPATINLAAIPITNASVAGLSFSYWSDSGGSTALVNASAISNSGNYFIKALDSSNCITVKPVTVVVYGSPILYISNPAPVCLPQVIDLSAATITTGSSANLSLSYWSDSAAKNALAHPSAISNAGIYFIKGSDSNGCSTIKPISVLINPKPVLRINHRLPVCLPGTVNLSSVAIVSGSPAGLNYSYWLDTGATKPVADPAALTSSGIYFIEGVDSNGCSDIEPVTVNIYASPELVIKNPGSVCVPDSVNLENASITNGSSPNIRLSYWLDSSATEPVTKPLAIKSPGIYFIKASDSNGCSSIKPVTVAINALPDLQAGTSEMVCPGTSVQLTATSAARFNWFTSDNSTLSCTTCNDPVARPSVTTTYYVNGYSDSGCVKQDSVAILVMAPKHLLLPVKSDSICKGQSVRINASGQFTYRWYPVAGLDNPDMASPVASPDTSTIYEVIGTDSLSCFSDTAFVKVSVFDNPVISLGGDPTIIQGTSYQISVSGSFEQGTVSWSPSAGLSCDNCLSPLATPTVTTDYVVSVKSAEGCSTRDSIKIIVLGSNLFIPNTFSPNNDGMNDVFFVQSRPSMVIQSMRIFNRWGQLVFERRNFLSNQPGLGWDGYFKGHQAPVDVYIYMLEILSENSKLVGYSGNVALIR
jgi:gliding motility-associated-like protein